MEQFEIKEICTSDYLIDLLRQKVFDSTLKYEIPPSLEKFLQRNNLLVQVKYLFAKSFHTRTYLYYLCSKDDVKFVHENSKTVYIWNPKKMIWEEHNTYHVRHIYLRYVISSIYMSICTAIRNIEEEDPISDSNLISTKEDLCNCLLKMLEISTLIRNINEILPQYVEYTIDENFPLLLNPSGYIAVKDNKIVDLKTGQVRDRVKTDYFTSELQLKYDPAAVSQLWERTLEQIMLYDKNKIRLLQEVLGYCLSGSCKEEKLIMIIGDTNSAKSFIVNILDYILGYLFTGLNSSLLVGRRKISFPAELKNKRIGVITDLEETDVIRTDKLKSLVSNNKYANKFLHSDFVEKTSLRHVIIVTSNSRPKFSESNLSAWEKLLVINFDAKFIEKPKAKNEFQVNRTLFDTLKLEEEAILKWIIDGAVRYYKNEKLVF